MNALWGGNVANTIWPNLVRFAIHVSLILVISVLYRIMAIETPGNETLFRKHQPINPPSA